LRQPEQRLDIHTHHIPEDVERRLTLRPAGRHAGIVDTDVDTAEPLERRVHERGPICGIGDVAAERMDPLSGRSELLEALESASAGDDVRTRLRQHRGEAGAESARGARHDRDPIGERSRRRRHDKMPCIGGAAVVDNSIGVVLA
jgi:hypothetical protein